MSKPAKIFVGVLSFWPLAYMFLFFAFFFGSFFGIFAGFAEGGESGPFFFSSFGLLFVLHGFTMLVSFGLVAFYVYHFLNDDELDETKSLLWSLMVFMGNMIAFPIAWYVHIWSDENPLDSEDEPAQPPPGR